MAKSCKKDHDFSHEKASEAAIHKKPAAEINIELEQQLKAADFRLKLLELQIAELRRENAQLRLLDQLQQTFFKEKYLWMFLGVVY